MDIMLSNPQDRAGAGSESGADRGSASTPPLIPAGLTAGTGMILVSACLLGALCRYDGQSKLLPELGDLVARGRVLPVCPEVAGGLPTPRLPAEIEGAHLGLDGNAVLEGRTRVMLSDGTDVTAQFVSGAQVAQDLARGLDIQQAILKANSPSCGVGRTYGGKFDGNLVAGDGVAAALLKRAGLEVITEENLATMSGDEHPYSNPGEVGE